MQEKSQQKASDEVVHTNFCGHPESSKRGRTTHWCIECEAQARIKELNETITYLEQQIKKHETLGGE